MSDLVKQKDVSLVNKRMKQIVFLEKKTDIFRNEQLKNCSKL